MKSLCRAGCSESDEETVSAAFQSLFTPVLCSWQVSDVGNPFLRLEESKEKELKLMLDWASEGFLPSGPDGFLPPGMNTL